MDELTRPHDAHQSAPLRGRLIALAAAVTAILLSGTAYAATTWTVRVDAGATGQAHAGTLAAPNVNAICTGNGGNKTPVQLSWTAVAQATGYTISQATSYFGSYTTIATGISATSYSLTPQSPGIYYWKVTATLSAWSSPDSQPVSRTTASNGNCF
jgi:hypothetical protein